MAQEKSKQDLCKTTEINVKQGKELGPERGMKSWKPDLEWLTMEKMYEMQSLHMVRVQSSQQKNEEGADMSQIWMQAKWIEK